MKTKIALLLSLLLGIISSTVAMAAECTSSFYCYGNTANTVVRVATRPPPIPPPNPRVVQQRRQAQIALRNSTPITPRIARPTATPAPQRITPVARPTPRAMPIPAPQRVIPAPNRVASNCQSVTAQASALESQAVIASKQNNRQRSVSLFKEAAKLRSQAMGMNCR